MTLRGFYPIVDLEVLAQRGLEPVPFAEQVLAARPPLLQLRAKSTSARDTLALLRTLLPLARQWGTLLFANDRPDLALLAGVDGVHVGQRDLPVADVRRLAPNLRVGISTHTADELEAALATRPDYVAHGPVFATTSKANPEPTVGLAGLARAKERANAVGIPLVAIGGIDVSRAAEVAANADLVAVIGALVPERGGADEVTARAVAFSAAVRGALSADRA